MIQVYHYTAFPQSLSQLDDNSSYMHLVFRKTKCGITAVYVVVTSLMAMYPKYLH